MSPINFIQILFQKLTTPAPAIQNIEASRKARLLSFVTLTIIPCTMLGTVATANPVPWVSVLLAITTVMLFFIYILSRTIYFKFGAILTIAAFASIPYVSVFFTEDYSANNLISIFAWCVLPIVLSHIFLSISGVMRLLLLHIIGLLLLTVFLPALRFEGVMNSIGFLLCVSVLLVTAMYHRNQIEQDRLKTLQKQATELSKINQELETLLFVISHDLKEPLRVIESFSDIVNRRYANQLDIKAQDFLNRVVKASHRLRELLKHILTLFRIRQMEPSTMQPILGEVIVQAALERLEEVIQQKEAKVIVACNLPALQVNKNWAIEGLYQLISNALKYTYESEAAEVEIATYNGPQGVGFVVKDRGIGVMPEYAERIFVLFQRRVGREVEGTGAGLAIVRQIAQQHGGQAWVKEREGAGSEFFITFGQAPTVEINNNN